MTKNILVTLIMTLMIITALAWSSAPEAADAVKALGTLTSIEEDGNIVIDEGGYEVASDAKILNSRGVEITLDRLTLPARITFVYINTSRGPEIRVIREMAQ